MTSHFAEYLLVAPAGWSERQLRTDVERTQSWELCPSSSSPDWRRKDALSHRMLLREQSPVPRGSPD